MDRETVRFNFVIPINMPSVVPPWISVISSLELRPSSSFATAQDAFLVSMSALLASSPDNLHGAKYATCFCSPINSQARLTLPVF